MIGGKVPKEWVGGGEWVGGMIVPLYNGKSDREDCEFVCVRVSVWVFVLSASALGG